MIIDRFWELLSKKESGEANTAELKEFEEILLTHPECGKTANVLSSLNFHSDAFAVGEVEQAFENHLDRMKNADIEFSDAGPHDIEAKPKHKNNTRNWWIISASATILLVTLFICNALNTSEKKNISKLSQVATKPGSKTQIQLPDGSTVWLNASSSITYDKNFGKSIREVNLSGEAFFDVTKDSSHPFIIHTNVIDIKVLGTAFNVRSYPGDANTETSLIRGKVEVTVKNRSNEKVYLEPNEKLIVANNNVTVNKSTIAQTPVKSASEKPIYSVQHLTYYPVDSTIIETSWVDNKLIFQENETFGEVALKMERWYGVKINFSDEEVSQIRLFGSFTNETVSQALDALRETFGFNYKISGNVITITK